MPVGAIFNGLYCREEKVIKELTENTGLNVVSDSDLIEEASRLCGMPPNKVEKAFSAKSSIFNQFTHEKERATAWLRLAAAKSLSEDNLLFSGFCTHLIPKKISHVLQVCLIGDVKFRIGAGVEKDGVSEKEAMNAIRGTDADRAAWVKQVRGLEDPWDSSLYDIVIPMDKKSVDEAVSMIQENLMKDQLKPNAASEMAVRDFKLAAEVGVALAKDGHNVDVDASDGKVILTVNKPVMMLSRLEANLKSIVSGIDGVRDVEVSVGEAFHQSDIYRRYDFELPSKVLLVDDERDFVESLSERLMMRDVGAAVVYDGESALNVINEDEPEVMILDLKMPGIDGIEVLRRVKQTRPGIEVIILTGKGSEADKRLCLELGAFAYLEKPFDIDDLSRTLKLANEKARKKNEERS